VSFVVNLLFSEIAVVVSQLPRHLCVVNNDVVVWLEGPEDGGDVHVKCIR
jgi:hypothetical protein